MTAPPPPGGRHLYHCYCIVISMVGTVFGLMQCSLVDLVYVWAMCGQSHAHYQPFAFGS